jgi:hypothetical protein
VFVAQGHLVVQHPAILSIRPPYPRFMQEGFPAGQRRAPLAHNSIDVFGMNRHSPVPAAQILERESYELQPGVIEEIDVAVGQSGMEHRGGRVNDLLKV